MRPFRAWIVRPDYAIAASAKCGSQSLLAYYNLEKFDRFAEEEVPAKLPKIGIVRNPIDRFWSLYANIQDRKRSHKNFYAQLEGKSPVEVFKALEHNWLHDIHYHPQYLIGLKSADYLIRLEDSIFLPHKNSSENSYREHIVGLENRIRSAYADDFRLWEQAMGGMKNIPEGWLCPRDD